MRQMKFGPAVLLLAAVTGLQSCSQRIERSRVVYRDGAIVDAITGEHLDGEYRLFDQPLSTAQIPGSTTVHFDHGQPVGDWTTQDSAGKHIGHIIDAPSFYDSLRAIAPCKLLYADHWTYSNRHTVLSLRLFDLLDTTYYDTLAVLSLLNERLVGPYPSNRLHIYSYPSAVDRPHLEYGTNQLHRAFENPDSLRRTFSKQ